LVRKKEKSLKHFYLYVGPEKRKYSQSKCSKRVKISKNGTEELKVTSTMVKRKSSHSKPCVLFYVRISRYLFGW